MKIAIIGVLDPLAQDYLASFTDDASLENEFIMIDFVEPAPILELSGTEYPVLHYTPDLLNLPLDLAICFGSADYKDIILELEDRKIKTIDLSGSFINEPTVPLVLFENTARADDFILAAPSLHLHVYGPLLQRLHQRFTVRRVALSVFVPAQESPRFLPDKMSEEEMSLINEAIRLIDNNQVHLTASIYPDGNAAEFHYHLDVEFVRPFNMDGIREVLAQTPDLVLRETFTKETNLDRSVLVHRVKRDFSADSGIHLHVSAQNPTQLVIDHIGCIVNDLNI